MNAWKHLNTINRHRFLVMRSCFRVGLYWQGLTHDLSKYAPTEFRTGAKYYVGTRSPNAVERETLGYSLAWMHHKGRNRHHYEYWTDFNSSTGRYDAVPMPRRYLAEMALDRIAACKTYRGAQYRDDDALNYFLHAKESALLHPQTARELRFVLQLLADRGEAETFRFLRRVVHTGEPFADASASSDE